MKIQDFHKTNSYELTNLLVDTFKTHAISGNQQRWSWQLQIKSLEDLFSLLLFVIKQYILYVTNYVILLFTLNDKCLLYYMWMCCDTCMTSPNPRMFPPYPGPGVWQIGIKAIGYSKLVNFLNEKEIQNLRL